MDIYLCACVAFVVVAVVGLILLNVPFTSRTLFVFKGDFAKAILRVVTPSFEAC